MKADCVMSSSSAMRTRCRYWSAVSPTLTMMSWPGLLMAYLPWNKKTMPEGMAKALDPEGETTGDRSSGREKVARISGGLLLVAVGGIEYVRIGEAQVHQSGIWNTLVAPFRYGLAGYIEQHGNCCVAT